jgi:putative oxidoreductase
MKSLINFSNQFLLITNSSDVSKLILRLSFSLTMLFAHGYGKLASAEQLFSKFPDPIGLGSELSYLLAVFAEFFCALFIALGIFTRLATIPLIITMLVAIFAIHINDPWHKIEFPLLYLFAFVAIFFSGAGKYSLDHKLSK